MAVQMAEVQMGHMLGTQSEPGAVTVVVSVAGSMTASSGGHGAVEELVSVTDLGSVLFGSSVVADCLWKCGTHLWTALALGPLPEIWTEP